MAIAPAVNLSLGFNVNIYHLYKRYNSLRKNSKKIFDKPAALCFIGYVEKKSIKKIPKKNTSNKNSEVIFPTEKSITLPALNSPLEENAVSIDDNIVERIKSACAIADVSINDYVVAIKRALWATKSFIGKDGEIHVEDDHDKRLKAALIGLELEGYIKNKAVTNDNSKHTHVTYSWQPVQVVNHNGAESAFPPRNNN